MALTCTGISPRMESPFRTPRVILLMAMTTVPSDLFSRTNICSRIARKKGHEKVALCYDRFSEHKATRMFKMRSSLCVS